MSRHGIFVRNLSFDGVGGSGSLATADYSSVADEVYFQPVRTVTLFSLQASIIDTVGMTTATFGTLAKLGTGIAIEHRESDDTVIESFTASTTINDNAAWVALGFDVSVSSWSGGNDILCAKLDFPGHGLRVYATEKIVVTLGDDFRGLVDHRYVVYGEGRPYSGD